MTDSHQKSRPEKDPNPSRSPIIVRIKFQNVRSDTKRQAFRGKFKTWGNPKSRGEAQKKLSRSPF